MSVAVDGERGSYFISIWMATVLQRTLTSRELGHLAPFGKKDVEHPRQESFLPHSLQHLRNLRH